MQQCQALVRGFLGRPWVDPTSSWHPSLPCSFQPFRLLWLPGKLLALVGASGPQDVCGGVERAKCGGKGRGCPQQPCGTTSTELTAAALPRPSHRCVGTARLAAAAAPGQGRDGRALRQEAYIPRHSGPPLGDLAGKEGSLWAMPPALGPGEKVPLSCPSGGCWGEAGGRQPADSALNGLQTLTSPGQRLPWRSCLWGTPPPAATASEPPGSDSCHHPVGWDQRGGSTLAVLAPYPPYPSCTLGRQLLRGEGSLSSPETAPGPPQAGRAHGLTGEGTRVGRWAQWANTGGCRTRGSRWGLRASHLNTGSGTQGGWGAGPIRG